MPHWYGACAFKTKRIGHFMPRLTNTLNVQIDSVHCRAICEEVGYRLRQVLENSATEHPPHLLKLLARLRRRDLGGAPSIVPSLPDIGPRRDGYRISMPMRKPTG
jgi:hypothetical protein